MTDNFYAATSAVTFELYEGKFDDVEDAIVSDTNVEFADEATWTDIEVFQGTHTVAEGKFCEATDILPPDEFAAAHKAGTHTLVICEWDITHEVPTDDDNDVPSLDDGSFSWQKSHLFFNDKECEVENQELKMRTVAER